MDVEEGRFWVEVGALASDETPIDVRPILASCDNLALEMSDTAIIYTVLVFLSRRLAVRQGFA